jgi:ABC-type Fe3+ transport system permease subunit
MARSRSLGYPTFTTEIFSEFSVGFDTASACALSLVLVHLCLIVVMIGERSTLRGTRAASAAAAPASQRVQTRQTARRGSDDR